MAKEYDAPMHTAEHILNQTMIRLFSCDRCFSSHLNSKKTKCDYYFPRPLTDEEAKKLEQAVNASIQQNMPVYEEIIPFSEAEKFVTVSKLPRAILEIATANTPVRLIRIGDYDVCPCIGEHVNNTQEIGLFRLVSHSFTQEEGKQGILRLRFSLGK